MKGKHMKRSSFLCATLLAALVVSLALPAGAGTGQDVDKSGDLVSVSSKAMQYTVSFPSSWMPAISFSDNGGDSMVLEQARFTVPGGAQISIAVWDSAGVESLDAWLRSNAGLLDLVDREATTRKVAGADTDGRVFFIDNSGGQAADQTKTYLIMNGRIFEVAYTMSDSGAAIKQYWEIVDSMTPGATGDSVLYPAELMPELQDLGKVYSCGGYSDTCYCAAWNPFPCCSNDANCTWWGWHKACCHWGIDIPPRGNANTWDETFRAYGYARRSCYYPAVGWIGVSNSGYYGHVAWVEQVSGNYVLVSEQNCNYGAGGVHYTWYSECYFDGGYFHP
jgi:hypothetical protein